jgi:hypothetical protein
MHREQSAALDAKNVADLHGVSPEGRSGLDDMPI